MSTTLTPPPAPCGCDTDPIAGLERLFVEYFQNRALATGRNPATRPVFLRLHGAASSRFEVTGDLPENLRVGLLQPGASYDAWVRFSSDLQPGVPDKGGTIGIAVKLFGVPGEKLLEPDRHAQTHDFILQNHPVFFVDNAVQMCEFTCESLNGRADAWIAAHPESGRILDAMAKVVDSVLASPYWSGLPYRLGDRHVKYKLVPELVPAGSPRPNEDPAYLRADLHARLAAGDARFGFYLQLRSGDMPLDRAMTEWSEEDSAPIRVATLVLPAQNLDARGQAQYGEALAFNPWHALPEHAPVGSLADARRAVYQASADNRRDVNGQPRGEPTSPRPAEWRGKPYPDALDHRIVRAAIHPAIGIARVGGARTECYIGPEAGPASPAEPGSRRDAAGALKRQAVRFRLYGYNASGEVVAELTSSTADITWNVHVANKKAAWYQWQIALDVPDAHNVAVPLRNPTVPATARDTLTIDPGNAQIRGASAAAVTLEGTFQGTPVDLGELRTDSAGRLLFLGGRGVSASPGNTPIYNSADPNGFINADGWYDDTSDGPVTATVSIEGRTIPVEGAWVVTAPPDYGPGVLGVRTLCDLLTDLYTRAGWMPLPRSVSFQNDVWPILRRLSGLQWVNQGFATAFGAGSRLPFDDPKFAAELAWKPAVGTYDRTADLRRQILNSFRSPTPGDANQLPWPWLYGDAMEVPAGSDPLQNASITWTQHQVLTKWAQGEFESDFDPGASGPNGIEAVPIAEQPTMLDRAALEHALADAFHPGCEVTWPMRHLTMYSGPFRIRLRPPEVSEPSYGKTLTQAEVLGPGGPLYAQGPGDLTRWMGLPWQADTAFCRSGYDKTYDPYIPSFWPARVPNQVVTLEQYRVLMDTTQPLDARKDAFADRSDWVARLQGDTAQQMVQMVHQFDEMGLLEARPGPSDIPGVPKQVLVASTGREPSSEQPSLGLASAAPQRATAVFQPLPVRKSKR